MTDKPSSNIKRLLEYLGREYSIQSMDGEFCIYRKINKYFDIEVSGCRIKNAKKDIYVWKLKPVRQTMWNFFGIKSDTELKRTLDTIVNDLTKFTEAWLTPLEEVYPGEDFLTSR
jgi:hypothetical protein